MGLKYIPNQQSLGDFSNIRSDWFKLPISLYLSLTLAYFCDRGKTPNKKWGLQYNSRGSADRGPS